MVVVYDGVWMVVFVGGGLWWWCIVYSGGVLMAMYGGDV